MIEIVKDDDKRYCLSCGSRTNDLYTIKIANTVQNLTSATSIGGICYDCLKNFQSKINKL